MASRATERRFRTQYDADYNSRIFDTDPGDDDSLVQQHMAEECDVNVIMRRYQSTGELTHIVQAAGVYGDFSDVGDYQAGINRIMEANSMFMELPSSVRDRFGNDPAKFVDFATDPSNIDEMRKMGLAPAAPPEPEPSIVQVQEEPKN